MKTTIKVGPEKSISVEPMRHAGGLYFELRCGMDGKPFCLTPDQAGALIFGIEQALDAIETREAA